MDIDKFQFLDKYIGPSDTSSSDISIITLSDESGDSVLYHEPKLGSDDIIIENIDNVEDDSKTPEKPGMANHF